MQFSCNVRLISDFPDKHIQSVAFCQIFIQSKYTCTIISLSFILSNQIQRNIHSRKFVIVLQQTYRIAAIYRSCLQHTLNEIIKRKLVQQYGYVIHHLHHIISIFQQN